MTAVSFFTPIQYKSTEAHGFFPALREVLFHHKNPEDYEFLPALKEFLYSGIEDYLCLRGDVVVIQPDGITASLEKYESSYLRTALKIISYPILLGPMIIGKIGLRFFSQSVVWFEGTDSGIPKEYVLPPSNQKISAILSEIMRKKDNKVFWLPHPEFVKEDEDHFPESKVSLGGLYQVREMCEFFPKKTLEISDFGRNEFFHWLNDSEMKDFTRSDGDIPIFMNCVDFVYAILAQNKLVSKESIIKNYQQQVKDKSNFFYGFNLDLFNDFDAIKGNPKEKPKPGDLLIGFEKNKPVHILFLTGKNLKTGEWKGMGLWNMGTKKPTPSNLELTKLQKDFQQYNEGNPLSFKYCSLETALDTLPQVD